MHWLRKRKKGRVGQLYTRHLIPVHSVYVLPHTRKAEWENVFKAKRNNKCLFFSFSNLHSLCEQFININLDKIPFL